MTAGNDLKGFSDWIRKRFPDDHETMLLLAQSYIRKNNIRWNLPHDRRILEKHLNGLVFKPQTNIEDFDDRRKSHSSVYQPFDLDDQDFPHKNPSVKPNTLHSDVSIREGEATDNRMDIQTDARDFITNIGYLPFPAEVKELLKELEDKSYKSPLLANFDNLGRMKLTRKAKIMAFLHRQNII